MTRIAIRLETPEDNTPITKVTEEAFKNHPFSQGTEQFIIHALRRSKALTLSLVAVVDGEVIGHIAFSPVLLSDGTKDWYGVGPLSVLPKLQKKGIGSQLMQEGLRIMKKLGAKGCMLVGDPAFYNRFGFRNEANLIHEGIPQEYFMILPFTKKSPKGTVQFHPGFLAKE